MADRFHEPKNEKNTAKHRISLERAFDMEMSQAVVFEDDRFDYGETRFVAYGPIDGRLHCLVFTYRGSMIRPISLRKANKREVKRYG